MIARHFRVLFESGFAVEIIDFPDRSPVNLQTAPGLERGSGAVSRYYDATLPFMHGAHTPDTARLCIIDGLPVRLP